MAEAGQDEARPDATPAENGPAPRRKGRLMLILGAAVGAGADTRGLVPSAYVFVPQVGEMVQEPHLGKKAKAGDRHASAGPSVRGSCRRWR